MAAEVDVWNITDLDLFRLNSAPLYGAFRMLGYWGLDSGYLGDPYNAWGAIYSSNIFIILSFLILS